MGNRSKIKLPLNMFVWALLCLLVMLNMVTIFIILQQQEELKKSVNLMVKQEVGKIVIPKPKDGMNGYTPIKNIDYFDGINGKNATDEQVSKAVSEYIKKNPPKPGKDGKTPVKGKDYTDGKTPEIRCDAERNAWVTRFSPEESWQLLNGERSPCVPQKTTQ